MREGAAQKYTTRFVMYAFLIIVSFISVFPLYWAIISAFNNTQQILGGRMIPSVHLMENLKNLFAQQVCAMSFPTAKRWPWSWNTAAS